MKYIKLTLMLYNVYKRYYLELVIISHLWMVKKKGSYEY